MHLSLWLLGQLHATLDGTPIASLSSRSWALLAYLAIESDRTHTRTQLADLFWPDKQERIARANLRQMLLKIRHVLGDQERTSPLLINTQQTVEFTSADQVWLDVATFTQLRAACDTHQHERLEGCAACIGRLREMVDLYRGPLLAGLLLPNNTPLEEWRHTTQERLHRQMLAALHHLANYHEGQGEYDEASGYAHRQIELEPWYEEAHQQLMRSLAHSGKRHAALAWYDRCCQILADELGIAPSDGTVRLYTEIRSGQFPEQAPALQAQRAFPAMRDPILAPSPTLSWSARSTGALPSGNDHNHGAEQAADISALVDAARPSVWAAHRPEPVAGVLPPLPTLLVGREEAIYSLKAHLGIGGEKRLVTVIRGWPGVGKSALLAALAHDHDIARAFPDGVFWASLGESPNLLAALLTWARALHLPLAAQPNSLEELTAYLTAALRDKRALLLVDNIWQTAHAAPFHVGGQQCALVMASRLTDVALALAPTPHDVVYVPLLPSHDALALLGMLAPQALAAYPDAARELVNDLERLPLAIQVAGRLLHGEAHLGWCVADLLVELRTGARLLAAQVPHNLIGPAGGTRPTIAALLQRSTNALDPQTRHRFASLGLFEPKPATFDLATLAVAWDVADPRPTVRLLVNRGLLEPVSGGRFQLHALLVLHARALLCE